MTIFINHPIEATEIFTAIFVIALFLSLKRRTTAEPFPVSVTHELKGLSILAIIFAHIGYSLVSDDRFLFPLSIMAGAGVDLFLFLSGYGLVVSGIKRNLSVKDFYRARLLKLFTPLWISIATFFLLDFFVLGKTYTWWGYVVPAFAGIFRSADLYRDLNSPLWYFTFIFFYYLIFPLVFFKKKAWLSAIVIYGISSLLLSLNPSYFSWVIGFYKLHTLAFPLGIIVGGMFGYSHNHSAKSIRRQMRTYVKNCIKAVGMTEWSLNLAKNIGPSSIKIFKQLAHFMGLAALIFVIVYTAFHSGVGMDPLTRQVLSLITVSALTLLFMLKKVEVRLLHWFGLYSYEIYLFHWPILSRYDVFFRFLPGWLAMVAYLLLFLALGRLLKKADKILVRKLFNS